MAKIIEPDEHHALTLEDYAAEPRFGMLVADLRSEAQQLQKQLEERTIWMVNSTAQGGGVAEMLPRLMTMIRELGFDVRWAVLETEEAKFFELTKRLHNLIHDDRNANREFTQEDMALYERVNRENADDLKRHMKPQDVLVVHDPQPAALGQMLQRDLGVHTFWRCHIGLDQPTPATRAAWKFLKTYLHSYHHAIFSVPEYIPPFLSGRTTVIYPGLDPLSHKSRELSLNKTIGILCNSGLQRAHEPVATPDFEHQAQRVSRSEGSKGPQPSGELGLLFRPIILQVSRWDRLKGWLPLLEGFVRMKERYRAGHNGDLEARFGNRIALSRLVLAGPECASIADDPEGLGAFAEICDRYRQLSADLQDDVIILELPMASRKENALIVNALQRCAAVVAQNSLREGFGLTVTEAMWKHVAVLGSHACGIRLQVRNHIDGLLTADPEDADEIASNLRHLLIHPVERDALGRNAQRRVYDEFLIFRQLARYFELFLRVL